MLDSLDIVNAPQNKSFSIFNKILQNSFAILRTLQNGETDLVRLPSSTSTITGIRDGGAENTITKLCLYDQNYTLLTEYSANDSKANENRVYWKNYSTTVNGSKATYVTLKVTGGTYPTGTYYRLYDVTIGVLDQYHPWNNDAPLLFKYES